MLFKQFMTIVILSSALGQSGKVLADRVESQYSSTRKLNNQAWRNLKLSHNEEDFYAYISELYKEDEYSRPQSCPLEPKGHEDVLKK